MDEWEATAWVESFGWTDDRVQAAFGLSNTRALGRYVSSGSPARVASAPSPHSVRDRQTAVAIVAEAYSRTLIYALPWLVTFAVEGLWPDAFDTQPEMAGPISVAVMVSLIATGGFVQAIARKGSFYLGMQQIVMARHVGWLLCRAGVASTLIFACAGLIAGSYFDMFGSLLPRLMALFYFVMLSVLWLACAMLSLQAPRWRVPMVFVAAGLVFALVKVNLGGTALAAQTAALLGSGSRCRDPVLGCVPRRHHARYQDRAHRPAAPAGFAAHAAAALCLRCGVLHISVRRPAVSRVRIAGPIRPAVRDRH